VLHKLPPPETSVQHRRGYQHLEDEEGTERPSDVDEVPSASADTNDEEDVPDEREVIEHQGWHSLIYSFTASAVLTVRTLHVE